MLTPNLHCAVCRLPRQEAVRGNAARETELWMERYMLVIKGRSKYKTIQHVEKSFVLNTESTARSLARLSAYHGCTFQKRRRGGVEEQALLLTGKGVSLASAAGRHLTGTQAEGTAVLVHALQRQQLGRVGDGAPDSDGGSVEGGSGVRLQVHLNASLCGVKIASAGTSARQGSCRAFPSSFVRAEARSTISLAVSGGALASAARSRPPSLQGHVYAYVQWFLQATLPVTNASVAGRGVPQEVVCNYAVVQCLQGPVQHDFAGTPTVLATEPVTRLPLGQCWLVPLHAIVAQLFLLSANVHSTDVRGPRVRMIECPGKLDMAEL